MIGRFVSHDPLSDLKISTISRTYAQLIIGILEAIASSSPNKTCRFSMASFVPPVIFSNSTQLSHLTSTNTTTKHIIPSPNNLPSPTILPQTNHANEPAPAITPRPPTVIWFRNDLRLHDHPALHAAISSKSPIAPLLLVPPSPTRFWCDAARDLRRQLVSRGAQLFIRPIVTTIADAVLDFITEVRAARLHFHTAVLMEEREHDDRIICCLRNTQVTVERFWTGALHTPQQLPFDVHDMPEDCDQFEALVNNVTVGKPLPAPCEIEGISGMDEGMIPIGEGIGGGGEQIGLAQIREYVQGGGLADVRRCGIDTQFGRFGRLLNLGCVSPRQLWYEVVEKIGEANLRRWCAEFELRWRSFVVFLTLKTGVFPA